MMDYLMQRDGRNPYGSRGGYVTSYDPRRRDRAMGERDYRNEEEPERREDYNYRGDMGYYGSRGDSSYYPFDVRGSFSRYDGHYDPYEEEMMYDYARRRNSRGQFMSDRAYDYARSRYGRDGRGGEDYLDEELLYRWCEKLKRQIDEKDKQFFSKENIIKKAETMGIKFDEFTPEEFVVVVLMMYTDYYKTLGSANMDLYLRLAKDWMSDDDSALKGGERLASYYYHIICGE